MTSKPKKSDLPQKLCPVCGFSFSWRKKWSLNWDSVAYCSERCKRNKKSSKIDE